MKNSKHTLGVALATICAFASIAFADIATSLNILGVNPGGDPINLTEQGTQDWIMLGQGGGDAGIMSRDEKLGVDYISAVTVVGTHGSFASKYESSWTDGSPTLMASNVQGNWEAQYDGSGNESLSFSVEGLAEGEYSMTVYAAKYRRATVGELVASIGENSTSVIFQTATGAVAGSYYGVYTINFDIETAGESLNIAYNMLTNGGNISNVSLTAITLAAIPEPATLGLFAAFGGGILFIRRRFLL
ncbi:MAG: PEP-CTERM sorting domain-containing protein [Pontiella sp.]